MQDRLDTLASRVAYLQRAPKLGNDAYVQQVAKHMRQAMDSDDRSLVPVFHMLTAGLDNLGMRWTWQSATMMLPTTKPREAYPAIQGMSVK
ncbi:hypothetical protein [Amycolatopsis tucumanensis]|uniref:hypothetical protein n=1 Tax=Amycolatopsis tucumanensis TaxID=401106 RepID=UPI003D71F38C